MSDERLGRRDNTGQLTILPVRYGTGAAIASGSVTRTEVALGDGWFYWLPPGTAALPPSDHDDLMALIAPARKRQEAREND